MRLRSFVWIALLLLAGGQADAENLQPRLGEIRWRLAGYVKARVIQPHEVAVIEEEVVNEGYEECTIPAGTPTANWSTPKPGATATQYRPGTYVTPYPIRVAVFTDPRLAKPRAFMIGDKRCFNFVTWQPPKKVAPPPAPPPVRGEVVIQKVAHGGSPAGWEFPLRGPNGFTTQLVTDAQGVASLQGLALGDYELTENMRLNWVSETQLPLRFSVTTSQPRAVLTIVNRYTPPAPPPPPVVKGSIVIQKRVTSVAGRVDGHQFKVVGPGVDKTLTTDAMGQATLTDLVLGHYMLAELHRDFYVPVTPMPVSIELTRDNPNRLIEVTNDYRAPAPPPVQQSIEQKDEKEEKEQPVRYRMFLPERVNAMMPMAQPYSTTEMRNILTFGATFFPGFGGGRRPPGPPPPGPRPPGTPPHGSPPGIIQPPGDPRGGMPGLGPTGPGTSPGVIGR